MTCLKANEQPIRADKELAKWTLPEIRITTVGVVEVKKWRNTEG
jgi:hypothetical protein